MPTQDTGSFHVTLADQSKTHDKAETLTEKKSGIHPWLRRPSQPAENLKAKGQPT